MMMRSLLQLPLVASYPCLDSDCQLNDAEEDKLNLPAMKHLSPRRAAFAAGTAAGAAARAAAPTILLPLLQ